MQLSGIDANLVVALRALLHQQNVTSAAKAVGLTQSTMSHALARLRAHFNDPLLVKVGRRMVLTERARQLIDPVAQAVAQLERVFVRQERFDPATSQRLFRIASTDNLEFYLLPKLVALLAKEAPGISIRVTQLSDNWIEALQQGDIDLKLGRKYAVPAGLRSQDLVEEHVCCAVARNHPPARGRLTIRQYAALPHLAVTPPTIDKGQPGGLIDALLARHGLQRRIVLTVPHFLVAPFVVASSQLVLTASRRLLAPFARSLGLRLLEPPAKLGSYKLSAVWSGRAHDDEAHQWLRAAIARAAAPS